ncbi:hypothetical protein OA326_02965 [Candidatus Pelagibacter sp.]|nr:hypothetical protein [Candidatus Pelagibacter sp.]
MSDDKKKKLFNYIEQSKKGTFDDYNSKIYPFLKTLNLTHDDAEELLNTLAGIEDRDDFYTQAHDVILTAVDDYKSENEEDNSMKDLIKE